MISHSNTAYSKNKIVALPIDVLSDHLIFLSEQFQLLYNWEQPIRPWHFWELHNPWSRSAALFDSWGFLDMCQSKSLLQYLQSLIGPDIILFDSRFAPDLIQQKTSDHHFFTDSIHFPVKPLDGLTVRIPITDGRDRAFCWIDDHGQIKTIRSTDIICHHHSLQYKVDDGFTNHQSIEYIIRYFPATSRYNRNTQDQQHKLLTDQFPLLNYAKMPLWLVCGEDRAGNDFVTGFNLKPGRWI